MSSRTIPTIEYVNLLKRKYRGLEVPIYKLRKWFSTGQKIFFDCKGSDKALCLSEILSKSNLSAFRIYLVVKDVATRGYCFMDVKFRNLGGKETLEHYINRYYQQLETMTKLSLQSVFREYISCIGHGYEETIP